MRGPTRLQPVLLLAVLAVACSTVHALDNSRFLNRQHGGSLSQEAPQWSYNLHGANWEGKCKSGWRQSPIDLPPNTTEDNRQLFFRYPVHEDAVTVQSDGRVLSVDFQKKVGGFGVGPTFQTVENSEKYALGRLVMHSPSEHLWEGKRAALELHLVHKRWKGEGVGIVAIGFTEGGPEDTSPFLSSLMQNGLPKDEGTHVEANTRRPAVLDFSSLMRESDFYMYDGSLTSPPCSPIAKYAVRKLLVPVSPKVLDVFTQNALKANGGTGSYRDVGALGKRFVVSIHATDAVDMKTAAEVVAETAQPAPAPGAEVEGKSGEDATEQTPSDKAQDPNAKKLEEIAENAAADSPSTLLNSAGVDAVVEDPDVVVDQNSAVVKAKAEAAQGHDDLSAAIMHQAEMKKVLDKLQVQSNPSGSKLGVAQSDFDAAKGVTAKARTAAELTTKRLDDAKQAVLNALVAAREQTVQEAKSDEASASGEAKGKTTNTELHGVVPAGGELPDHGDPFSMDA